MRILIHKSNPEYVHEDTIECWCKPLVVTDPDELTLEEFRAEMATERLRQERISAKWLH